MDRDWLEGVRAALEEVSGPVDVFFRDDDAPWAPKRLRALLDRFERAGLPLDLAVIPAELEPDLAAELAAGAAGLHQHGYAHANHERAGRKCEFGPSRSLEDQRRDIAEGRRLMHELLGARADPIFTPPWNRCTADTVSVLTELGFTALSRESRAEPFGVPGLAELPVTIDWVKFDAPELGERIAAALCGAAGPVGLMFHHEVMEEDDMRRTAELLELFAGHGAIAARPMRELVC